MRFTVKAKLASAFGGVILLSMIAGGMAYMQLNELIGTTEGLVTSAARIQKAADLQKAIMLQIRVEKNAILATSDADTDQMAAELVNIRKTFNKTREELYAIASETGRKMIDKLTAAYAKTNIAQDESIRL